MILYHFNNVIKPFFSTPCPSCNLASIPKTESKTWRTFDGSSCSRTRHPRSSYKTPKTPKAERRCDAIVVPTERRRRPPSPPPRF
ncbi:uncharacterized protein LOC114355364 isoform X2 [Ostrinia furnacalis]|uniref:uncharacterized protein LOC114355364 isoform X2 n=1 Tax=Ostrinia furnacalis TaxID=93504 RepID=UPI00103BC3FE|nr:uncharacterized protein LOC114355364 isoform X2 [Ostrinia furnacalis]